MNITVDEETAVAVNFYNTEIIAELRSHNGKIMGKINSLELGQIGN